MNYFLSFKLLGLFIYVCGLQATASESSLDQQATTLVSYLSRALTFRREWNPPPPPPPVSTSSNIVVNVAGNGVPGYSGDNGLGVYASLSFPDDVTIDLSGNVFISDTYNNVIRVVSASTGIITTYAGISNGAYPWDNCDSRRSLLSLPRQIAFDSFSNLYIADTGHNVVRVVNRITGVISTYAGVMSKGWGRYGDGELATNAILVQPYGVALDASNNLYISDTYLNTIRVVYYNTKIITTFAGSWAWYYDCPISIMNLRRPAGMNVFNGFLYVADSYNNIIRKINVVTGAISIAAGSSNFRSGYSGDGDKASKCLLNLPNDVAIDAYGNLYIVDLGNSLIRYVSAATGVITTFAGTGSRGYNGNGLNALKTKLNYPYGISVFQSRSVYFADTYNNLVRLIVGTSVTNRPTAPPTPSPSKRTIVPSFRPTRFPTKTPTRAPSALITRSPSSAVTVSPTSIATRAPSAAPSPPPSAVPSRQPTPKFTAGALKPTAAPTISPSLDLTSSLPTSSQTESPSSTPTSETTPLPSAAPTILPSSVSTVGPTSSATATPSSEGTVSPSATSSVSPSAEPSVEPTNAPTCDIGSLALIDVAPITSPYDVAVTTENDVYVSTPCAIMKIDGLTSAVSTYAGTGVCGITLSGTNPLASGPATSFAVSTPTFVDVDSQDSLFFIDYDNSRVLSVQGGVVSTWIVLSSITLLNIIKIPLGGLLAGIAIDKSTNIVYFGYNSKSPFGQNRVYSFIPGVSTSVTTVTSVGQSIRGMSFGLIPHNFNSPTVTFNRTAELFVATSTAIIPTALPADNPGAVINLFGINDVSITESGIIYANSIVSHLVYQVDYVYNEQYSVNPDYYYAYIPSDNPYAGTGLAGYTGDGITATSSRLNGPSGVGLSSTGVLYIADTSNNLVRKIDKPC